MIATMRPEPRPRPRRRPRAIYQPAGAAGELAPYACNLYWGCTHACSYCYVPAVFRVQRHDYNLAQYARPGILAALDEDAARHRARVATGAADPAAPVLLCFTSDPYGAGRAHPATTREALLILRRHRIPWIVLSKAGPAALADLDLYGPCCIFGATLTCADPDLAALHEPRAAPPASRIAALIAAHRAGVATLANLEPIVDASGVVAAVFSLHPHVTRYVVGPLNRYSSATTIPPTSPTALRRVVAALDATRTPYTVKRAGRALLSNTDHTT
jgi:DNA repair photolyase